MKKTILKTNKLSKTFLVGDTQQHVIKNLDLEIYEGDFTVIMGASGAGKSTLLYTLSGMDAPSLGTVEFMGTNISGLSSDKMATFRRQHCGFVFQQMFLLDNMSIMDNVMACGLLVSKDKKAIVSHARKLFSDVNLGEDIFKKFPSQVSGGEAQRAAIVRALINNPPVIFADEPTGALNSSSGSAVLDTLTKVNQAGQSIVMVTHDIKSAMRGNRILYVMDGVIRGTCELGRYENGDEARRNQLGNFLVEMGW
ncbi:MAG: ABC transporter ATP-binding protein [Defluviitaleaceae bacterium]|nr:ABC transporter ATP-binding protein [Defluviitaleaceae bacterium]